MTGSQRGDAERREVELAKLKAEKDKLEAEKKKLETDQQPDEVTNPRAFAELAKLKAEKEKLEAEKKKLESDQRPQQTDPRAFAELSKLEAEKAKLEAEKDKIGSDKFTEWGKTGGALLIGIGALLTFSLGFCTRQDEKDARFRADAAHLVENLGASKAQVRTAAAIGLRSFLSNDKTRDFVVDSLAFGLALESELGVQQAMADSLASVGEAAALPLHQMLSRVNGEVRTGFNKLGPLNCTERTNDLEPIRAKQNAMIAAVLALAQIGQRSGRTLRLDFSKLNFKCFELTGVSASLSGAIFREATIWDADFFNMDLRDCDFSNAQALDAKFTDAILDGADFTGAVDLTEVQLKAAKSLTCAKFDAPLAGKLANETKPPPGRTCSP